MQENELWIEFKNGSKKAREFILIKYLPLVKTIAFSIKKRLPLNSQNIDELISSGVLGLVQAVDNFNSDLGLKFITYALPRIRGSILDELRNIDFLPRSARDRVNHIKNKEEELTQKLKRNPSQTELAKEVNLSIDGIYLYDKLRYIPLSIDSTISDSDGFSLSEIISYEFKNEDPINLVSQKEEYQNVMSALNRLSPKDKLIIGLYYIEGFRFNEIGKMLGITESRISQIHSKGLGEMKTYLEKFC